MAITAAILVSAALVARRNYLRGRGDVRGAWRIASFVLASVLLAWVMTAHHVTTGIPIGPPAAFWALAAALCYAAACWVLYLAVEPFVRSRWPQGLITWTRVLAADVRSPLVGGHLLAGTALGVAFALWYGLRDVVMLRAGAIGDFLDPTILQGPGWMLSSWLSTLGFTVAAR